MSALHFDSNPVECFKSLSRKMNEPHIDHGRFQPGVKRDAPFRVLVHNLLRPPPRLVKVLYQIWDVSI